MRPEDLLCPTPQGLYCPPADVYIDPMKPVPRALVTHGHSDHARAGHGAVLATAETLAIMAVRYGDEFTHAQQPMAFGETVKINDVAISFHPAGHVLGSAQLLFEWQGYRAVVSGDYKRLPDRTAGTFEPVHCNLFVTEATFGLPVFRHPPTEHEVAKLLDSVSLFPERAHLVGAYPLGKAQRLMALMRDAGYDRPIYVHGALVRLTELYKAQGIALGDIRPVQLDDRKSLGGAIVICPPSALQDLWSRKFPDPVSAFASGWMRVRARAKQKGVELPLVVSDHADWDDLGRTIRETGAEDVWVTHGAEEALVRWCELEGIRARPLNLVGYGDEEEAA
jgi:putative mRNA 3-end processing factor